VKPEILRGRFSGHGAGVYAIVHVPTSRAYVGGTVNLIQRGRGHERHLLRGDHRNSLLQAAWTQDGPSAFEFVVLELVNDKADLLAREQYHIDRLAAYFKSGGFNLVPLAGTQKGLIHSEESKAHFAETHRGMKASSEARALMAHHNRELWRQPEYRARMLAKRAEKRGVRLSDEHRAKLSRTLSGKKRTPEQCERMSIAQRAAAAHRRTA
jgi:group I intron endonuclease